jgi:hypothetical protein
MTAADGAHFIEGLTAYDLRRKPQPLVSVALFSILLSDELC